MAKKVFKIALVSVALFFVLVLPLVVSAQGLVKCGNPGQPACTYGAFVQLVKDVVSFALTYIAIPAATIIIVFGGIKMAISAGNESKFKEGRKYVTAAAVGLVITFGAWLIVNTVLSFLKITAQ